MRKLFTSMTLVAAAVWGLTSSADALGRERVQLSFGGQQFRGQQTIKLRQKLRQQHGIVSQGRQLVAAVVVGKSKHGMGTVKLKVGGALSYAQTLDGYPSEFNRGGNFYRVRIQNPQSYNSQGVWQLKLKGNIKIKKVVLILEDNFVGGRRCSAEMQTRRGRTIDTFTARNCRRAMAKCQNDLTRRQNNGQNPFASCQVSGNGGGNGGGNNYRQWTCTATDTGWEEHWWRGGHVATNRNVNVARRLALRDCKQSHGNCRVSCSQN
ncbi:MAG: hypothetical protein HN353_11780 [Bdellovibrionales bacterium]|nr:hypothetical protein [Bdellovibrionales bacterium]MBT3526829.1 hypothetical protein [Bdellovibrionales bacterium]MBT7668209.1 hypothetical protein [Bdellovibrionales bacterium]MBT7767096.1 hypothetical protein [Bdellovibrionales bacterium]